MPLRHTCCFPETNWTHTLIHTYTYTNLISHRFLASCCILQIWSTSGKCPAAGLAAVAHAVTRWQHEFGLAHRKWSSKTANLFDFLSFFCIHHIISYLTSLFGFNFHLLQRGTQKNNCPNSKWFVCVYVCVWEGGCLMVWIWASWD